MLQALRELFLRIATYFEIRYCVGRTSGNQTLVEWEVIPYSFRIDWFVQIGEPRRPVERS